MNGRLKEGPIRAFSRIVPRRRKHQRVLRSSTALFLLASLLLNMLLLSWSLNGIFPFRESFASLRLVSRSLRYKLRRLEPDSLPKNDTSGDFCSLLKYYVPRAELRFNPIKRPVIDRENRVFLCVTPKAGISKMEELFMDYYRRQHPLYPLSPERYEPHSRLYNRSVVANRNWWVENFGSRKPWYLPNSFVHPDLERIGGAPWTRVFVFRNPVDRFVSLYLDKFSEERMKMSWVAPAFYQAEKSFDLDKLLDRLEFWLNHPRASKDPHIWPQTHYCELSTTPYNATVEIDDPRTLVEHLGPVWGVKDDAFDRYTRHSTKHRTDDLARRDIEAKLWKYRREFLAVYWDDVKLYCDRGHQLVVATGSSRR